MWWLWEIAEFLVTVLMILVSIVGILVFGAILLAMIAMIFV